MTEHIYVPLFERLLQVSSAHMTATVGSPCFRRPRPPLVLVFAATAVAVFGDRLRAVVLALRVCPAAAATAAERLLPLGFLLAMLIGHLVTLISSASPSAS
jgi:hypothetical protein